MSKIAAVDFANYVRVQKNILADILKNKGIPAENVDNKSLGLLVSTVDSLPSDSSDDYHYDAYFQNLINTYKQDPELRANGGTAYELSYIVIDNTHPSTILAFSGNASDFKIKYSDSTEEVPTTLDITTHNWNDTDANLGTLEDGTRVRLIKIYNYSNGGSSQSSLLVQPCISNLNEDSVTNPTYDNGSDVLFYLFNNAYCVPVSGTSTSTYNSYSRLVNYRNLHNLKKLRAIYYGEKAIFTVSNSGSSNVAIYNCPKLECVESEAIIDITFNSNYIMQGCSKLKYFKLKIKSFSLNTSGVCFNYGIAGALPDIAFTKLSNFQQLASPSITSGYYPLTFGRLSKKYIPALLSNLTYWKNGLMAFSSDIEVLTVPDITFDTGFAPIARHTPNLRTLTLPNNFNVSIYLQGAPCLSDESIADIASKLADRTGQSALTITFPTVRKFTIPQTVLDIITNKNWTISWAS